MSDGLRTYLLPRYCSIASIPPHNSLGARRPPFPSSVLYRLLPLYSLLRILISRLRERPHAPLQSNATHSHTLPPSPWAQGSPNHNFTYVGFGRQSSPFAVILFCTPPLIRRFIEVLSQKNSPSKYRHKVA